MAFLYESRVGMLNVIKKFEVSFLLLCGFSVPVLVGMNVKEQMFKSLETATTGESALEEIKKIDVKELANVVNLPNEFKRYALIIAAEKGFAGVVQYLVDRGANVDKEDEHNKTAFSQAVRESHPDVVSVLLPKEPHFYSNPLVMALNTNKDASDIIKVLELLLKKFDDRYRRNMAFVASAGDQSDKVEIVKFLLDQKGVDINYKDKDGYTALMNAALYAQYDIAKFLLDSGADSSLKNNAQKTALDLAKGGEQEEHKRIAKMLEAHQQKLEASVYNLAAAFEEVKKVKA